MPKRKAPKKKVRHVYVPEGDEGKHLSAADKAAKLESFVQQFDMEGMQVALVCERNVLALCTVVFHLAKYFKKLLHFASSLIQFDFM